MEENNNIYPIFDRMLTRQDKEELLKQRGVMIWFTGLSGSGKSTIAIALERELHKRGLLCRILDGDTTISVRWLPALSDRMTFWKYLSALRLPNVKSGT